MNKIFQELKAIHPAWKQAISTDLTEGDIKKQFLRGFIESGVSNLDVINKALELSRASKNPFLPTIGQFIGYCKTASGELIGALNAGVAYGQLLKYYARPIEDREPMDLNPIIYHTISQLEFDSFYFKSLSSKDAIEYFELKYNFTIDHVFAGGTLDKPAARSKRISFGRLGNITKDERAYGNAQSGALLKMFG